MRRWARCTTCPVSPCGGWAGPRRREEAEAEPELGKSVPHRRDGGADGLLHGCCPARPLHSASIWVSPSVCGGADRGGLAPASGCPCVSVATSAAAIPGGVELQQRPKEQAARPVGAATPPGREGPALCGHGHGAERGARTACPLPRVCSPVPIRTHFLRKRRDARKRTHPSVR